MLEKVALILFYAVMALVATTCIVNIGPISALRQREWFEAWGSWVSGIASLAAVGAALFIAFRQERNERRRRAADDALTRDVIVLQVALWKFDLTRHSFLRGEKQGQEEIEQILRYPRQQIEDLLLMRDEQPCPDLMNLRSAPDIAAETLLLFKAVVGYNRKVRRLGNVDRRMNDLRPWAKHLMADIKNIRLLVGQLQSKMPPVLHSFAGRSVDWE